MMFWKKNRYKKVKSEILSKSDIYTINTNEELCFALDLVVYVDGTIESSILKSPNKSCLESVKVGDVSYLYRKYII